MSRLGVTTKVDNQKQVVNVNPVNNISVSVRSPSDIQQEAMKVAKMPKSTCSGSTFAAKVHIKFGKLLILPCILVPARSFVELSP